MKKTITALSLLSGLVAVLSVILNIQVLFNGNSWFFRFAMFSITRGGGFMGYLGNLMSMLIVALGFGVMCVCGLRAVKGHGMKVIRSALIAGAFMTVMAIISLICSISKGIFNFGDIIVLAMPAVYTFCLFPRAISSGNKRIRNDVRFVGIYKERREWLSITFGAFLLLNGRNERNRSRQPNSWLTCKNGAETFNPRRFQGPEKTALNKC